MTEIRVHHIGKISIRFALAVLWNNLQTLTKGGCRLTVHFFKKVGETPISFIYHNADSANNRLIVTLINIIAIFTIGHDLPKL